MQPHRLCDRCGNYILKSDLEQYPYQCMYCDEDLFSIETHLRTNDYGQLVNDEISIFAYCDLIEQVSALLCLDDWKGDSINEN